MNLHYVQGNPLFTHINKIPKQYNYLTENIETDIIIIGGGVTGSITAYYFSNANIPVVLLEKSRIAHGSTSITTSLLQYELDGTARNLEQYTSLDNTIRAYKLGLKALDEIDNFIIKHGNKCDYERKDTLFYTGKKSEISLIRDEYNVRKNANLDVNFITEENNPFSFDLKAGVYANKGGAQLDPYKFTHHLLDVSCNLGLKVYENTEVLEINYGEDKVEVITSYGYKVTGKKVIVATGYDVDKFTKRNFGLKTLTYNIATKPVESFEGWNNRVIIRDSNDPYNYYRTTSDNRILAGGEDIYPSFQGFLIIKKQRKTTINCIRKYPLCFHI